MIIKCVYLISGYLKLLLLWLLELMRRLPLSVRYQFTDLLSICVCLILVKKKNIVRRNLSVIKGPDVSEEEIRNVFKSYGRYWAEIADIESLWKKQLKIICGPDFPPEEKCFLGITFHVGNFEMFGPAIYDYCGCDLTVVAERLCPPVLFEYFFRMRKKHHFHTIAHDNPREIIAVLKEGKPLGVLCDRSVGTKVTDVKLFGVDWAIPISIVKYALAMKIPVYYAYCINENSVIQLFCKKVNIEQSFEDVTKEIAQTLEGTLRNYPLIWHNISQELR